MWKIDFLSFIVYQMKPYFSIPNIFFTQNTLIKMNELKWTFDA